MSLADWWRSWIGENRPVPPEILSEAEATERVRDYAAVHGYIFEEPFEILLERRVEGDSLKAARPYVYVMGLGTNRPMPFVEVDAADGTVLEWRTLPR